MNDKKREAVGTDSIPCLFHGRQLIARDGPDPMPFAKISFSGNLRSVLGSFDKIQKDVLGESI